jgi:hypothetical protein
MKVMSSLIIGVTEGCCEYSRYTTTGSMSDSLLNK